MAGKSIIKQIKARIKSLIWFLECPNFFLSREKYRITGCGKKKKLVGKSKVGNCYSSVIHYLISLIRAQLIFASSSSPGPRCPCSGRSVRQAGEQKRKHGRRTGTFCFIRCRCVPPRHHIWIWWLVPGRAWRKGRCGPLACCILAPQRHRGHQDKKTPTIRSF